jgi:hypothetical protein
MQRASRLHEPRLAPERAGEFKEIAQRLPFVAARRFLEEAIEVQSVALAPQHEREDTGDRRIAVRKRQGFADDLLDRWDGPLRLGRAERSTDAGEPSPYLLIVISALLRFGIARSGSKVPQQFGMAMVSRCTVDERSPLAFRTRETRRSHCIQLAVSCGVPHLREPGEIADAAGRAPPPQEPKELPAGPSGNEIIKHGGILSQ